MVPRLTSATVLAVAVSIVLPSTSAPQAPTPSTDEPVVVQLLAFNDFHGHLEPPTGSNGRIGSTDAGGVEYLATHLAQLEAHNPNTLIVAAGDLIGASPLLSGLFHDEPTIEALNAAGLDVSSVGNHEFDEGWVELSRMQHGGCHPIDGCQDKTPFAGATFQYLAANVFLDPRKADKATLAGSGLNLTDGRSRNLLPPHTVKDVGGVKVAFIGLTLKGTPQLVQPTGIQGLTFRSEAETVNVFIPVLKQQGVRAIVVLVHEGGVPAGNDHNGCEGVSGAIEPIARRMSDEVDVIVSGHTHTAYICTFDRKLITSAASYGRLITAIELRIDKRTDEVVSKTARNVIVTRDVAKSPEHTAILDRYRPFHSTVAGKIVGTIAHDITRTPNAAGESALGDVVADAMLEATSDVSTGSPAIAFMNPGGLRADLARDSPSSSEGPSAITYAQVFNVHPFQNRLVVKTLTGEMIRKVLEQQFDNRAPGTDMILQVSAGFSYSYDRSKPKGKRVDSASMMVGGQPIGAKQKYRVGITEFLADGGDNFTVFTQATDPVYAGMDADALSTYLSRHSPVIPGPMNRITRTR
jgi:5'-nucleotidase